MKKTLSVLLSIIMVISVLAVIPFTANAEINSVTIGELSSMTWGIPTHQMAKYTKSHYIIAESDMGALKGKVITGLRWYFQEEEYLGVWEYNSPEERNVDIYLTETDLKQVTSLIDVSSSTRVFSGIWSFAGYSDLSDISASLIDVTFDCPYLYSGKNLLVTVVDKTGYKEDGTPHTLCYYSANGGYRCAGDDSISASDTDSKNTTKITGDYIPVTTFYYAYAAYIPGDINGDGSVNNKDLTRLFQYLSDWDVEVTESALDINGDGSVNNKDLTRLFQYLSDWDVKIH
ncbi:MAG: dockerin type I repeat-containing protein [Clostridia bacterium]|nr:dockerin type I repeat-containing protein [Clostridia bacterium]